MTDTPSDAPRLDEAHPTPATARVLADTGGWPSIIEEEWDWIQQDRQRTRTQRQPASGEMTR